MNSIPLLFEKKEFCSGCSSCMLSCPTSAISMYIDEEGFQYPIIDEKKCINCKKCLISCRFQLESYKKGDENFEKPITYAAVIMNEEILKESSSGGVFSAISDYIIKHDGYVTGALFEENMEVRHICTNNISNIKLFRKSKYVQSNINGTYRDIKKKLIERKFVLFSGTPCEVAGLYAFLGKDYETLFTIDLLCKGVPSPKLFKDYLTILERKFGRKIINYEFRTKDLGWGKKRDKYIKIFFENGIIVRKRKCFDTYYGLFSRVIALRPTCIHCIFKKTTRESDITLGDCYNVERFINIDTQNGVSLVMINSLKGGQLFNRINSLSKYLLVGYLENNPRGVYNFKNSNYKYRNNFFRDYNRLGYSFSCFKYVVIPRFYSYVSKFFQK